MNKSPIRMTQAQKKAEPLRPLELQPEQQQEKTSVQQVAPQGAYRRTQATQSKWGPADLLALQRTVGNRGVQRILRLSNRIYGQPQALSTKPEIIQRQGCATDRTATPTAEPTAEQQALETWSQQIETQIEQFLDRFSNIPVTVTWQENGETRSESVGVHPPYFINRENTANRLSTALGHRNTARGALATLLRQIKSPAPEAPPQPGEAEQQAQPSPVPSSRAGHGRRRTRQHAPAHPRAIQPGNVRGRGRALVGKSTPEDIQTILQEALNQGLVPAGGGRTHPDATDLRAWLVRYGIGVDCSGFVSQTLNQVMSAMPGGATAPQLSITGTNARALTGRSGRGARFTRVARPSDLCPGDTMGLPGHIRIVMRVETTPEGIQITTAESSSGRDIGPTRAVWLYPDPTRFTRLQRRHEGPPPPPRQPRHGRHSHSAPPPTTTEPGSPQPAYHWQRSTEQVTWGRYSRLGALRPTQAAVQRTPLATVRATDLNQTRRGQAGNLGIAIQRQARLGWSGVSSGPNRGETAAADAAAWDFGQIRRIALQGLGSGRSASTRQAIVLIPTAITAPMTQPTDNQSAPSQAATETPSMTNNSALPAVEVLLHLHGHNVGYQGTSLRNVRDVQADQIEQQLQASRRRMIAVLPQGSNSSEFGIANPNQYLQDVFAGLTQLGVWGPHTPPAISSVILSGHSGAGNPISQMLQAGSGRAIANLGGLFLFDAINGPHELNAVQTWVTNQLNHDLSELTNGQRQNNIQAQQAYLMTSMRLRGFYTPGHYARLYQPLITTIDTWFNTQLGTQLSRTGITLNQTVINQWAQNYRIFPAGHSNHNYIVGQGHSAVQGKGGPGALFDALGALPPGTMATPGSQAAQTGSHPSPTP